MNKINCYYATGLLIVLFLTLINNRINAEKVKYVAPSTYAAVGMPTEEGWRAFQVGILPDYPIGIRNSRVDGLKLGLPFSGGKRAIVNGTELSLLGSSTYTVEGWQLALLVSAANHLDGAQMAVLTSIARQLNGFQFSLVNVAREVGGWQVALYNAATYDVEGLQLGGINSAQTCDGVQIGLFNITEKNACQIGLINIIEDGWLPVSILFNWSFNNDSSNQETHE